MLTNEQSGMLGKKKRGWLCDHYPSKEITVKSLEKGVCEC